ncbi:MAG: helix-turn-helix transcriptional regulator [Methyloprofundus sp.]|nr:helix-turn-helix transcriptional regulator [Methyloprofundus sp.]
MKISSILKNKRLEKSLTQKELADSSGVTQSMISRVEKGELENITVGILRKLAKALHCLPIDLLPDSDKKPEK